jgi:hypothetical protein
MSDEKEFAIVVVAAAVVAARERKTYSLLRNADYQTSQ